MTSAMTRHYQSHADREARLQGISLMRGLISKEPEVKNIKYSPLRDVLRERITSFVNEATEIQLLQLNVIIDKLAANELQISSGEEVTIDAVKLLPNDEKM